MMRAGDDVGDYFGFGRIWNGRFQYSDDGGRSRAEPETFAEHGWIALESGRPESISQHRRAGGVRTVVMCIEQPAEHWVQPHDLEIRPADDTGADLARLA